MHCFGAATSILWAHIFHLSTTYYYTFKNTAALTTWIMLQGLCNSSWFISVSSLQLPLRCYKRLWHLLTFLIHALCISLSKEVLWECPSICLAMCSYSTNSYSLKISLIAQIITGIKCNITLYALCMTKWSSNKIKLLILQLLLLFRNVTVPYVY